MSIAIDSLMSLEAWHKHRKLHKPELMAHRRLRSVRLGEHMTLQFEDERTIRYQIQEMLRIEKIFDEEGIQAEIDAYAIADEDLERETDEKTSAVHFLRFEFAPSQVAALRAGAAVRLGCDHTNYPAHLTLAAETLASLAGDLRG